MESRIAHRNPNQEVPTTRQPRTWVAPPVDVFENADEILLVADVPGLQQESLSIELDRGELRLEGSRPVAEYGTKVESPQTLDYRRVFTVPDGIDANAVKAELKDGVLYVHLPKAPDIKPRKIEVKAS